MVAWNSVAPDPDLFWRFFARLKATARSLQQWSSRVINNITTQLGVARELIARFDAAQDFRPLTPAEVWLRRELKCKYLGLASPERSIAWQRIRLCWLKEGEASAAFPKIHASHRAGKNNIFDLTVDGHHVSGDENLAQAAFDHFSSILGGQDARGFTVDLDAMHHRSFDLSELEAPFSPDEIREAIKKLPSGKAPGLDGFSTEFLCSCWDVIKHDLCDVFDKLYALNGRAFQRLNEALITLIRKRPDTASMFDYQPISLIHLIGKLFTKVLSLRLAPRLGEMVSSNQSAFIAGRSVHVNFILVQQTARQLHRLGLPRALLKLDIARAFDSVSWPFLLQVLEHLGFGPHWREWISILISTASTRVMINGTPGPPIAHHQGLWQGDPVSPMLFTLAIDVLKSLLQHVVTTGTIRRHTEQQAASSVSLFADDVVIFCHPDPSELSAVSGILDFFGSVSDIRTNFAKCLAAPVPASQLQPIIDKLLRKLATWKAALLSRGELLALVRQVLTAMPVHILLAMSLSPPILKKTGISLRVRWLWLSASDSSRPWSHLQPPTDPEALQFFRASTSWILGNGTSCRFWTDKWMQGRSIQELAPSLVALVLNRSRRSRTIAAALLDRTWIRDIHGSPGPEAMLQYVDLWRRLQSVALTTEPDIIRWKWTEDGEYSAASCYDALFIGSTASEHWRIVWKTGAPLSVKFFTYLASINRCWTADRLSRRGLPHKLAYVLCS
ncbi:uncharacterized protein [Aegilops tauschii subsp. strangulata]|uniref:uncharacterized protein n=1 Tax=Aegilops tauschii subsp. strangulata TaxID=200361 RepID=UPI00098A620B|nr:uncharacterized protein LOC109773731 [Aegilops tauschii subsp. strangulata]